MVEQKVLHQGASVTYKCGYGYTMNGDNTLTSGSNWTFDKPARRCARMMSTCLIMFLTFQPSVVILDILTMVEQHILLYIIKEHQWPTTVMMATLWLGITLWPVSLMEPGISYHLHVIVKVKLITIIRIITNIVAIIVEVMWWWFIYIETKGTY